jgi:hypothetical protein
VTAEYELRAMLHELADRQTWSAEAFSIIRELRDCVTDRINVVTQSTEEIQ